MSFEPEASATDLLNRLCRGDARAAEALMPWICDELRQLAAMHLHRGRGTDSLDPTDLVGEAWVRLGGGAGLAFASRSHFFALASKAMRSVLMDHARSRAAEKRGGDRAASPLSSDLQVSGAPGLDVLALDEALERLQLVDPELVRLVELRVFGGLGHGDIAQLEGCSVRTVEHRWRLARAWLRRSLA